MKTRRKLLALVLTFCMALSLVPFGALAEEPQSNEQEKVKVTFVTDYGTAPDPITVNKGETLESAMRTDADYFKLYLPNTADKVFIGWSESDSTTDVLELYYYSDSDSPEIEKDITLNAVFWNMITSVGVNKKDSFDIQSGKPLPGKDDLEVVGNGSTPAPYRITNVQWSNGLGDRVTAFGNNNVYYMTVTVCANNTEEQGYAFPYDMRTYSLDTSKLAVTFDGNKVALDPFFSPVAALDGLDWEESDDNKPGEVRQQLLSFTVPFEIGVADTKPVTLHYDDSKTVTLKTPKDADLYYAAIYSLATEVGLQDMTIWDILYPRREGYMFAGWYRNEDFSGVPVYSNSPGFGSSNGYPALYSDSVNTADLYSRWLKIEPIDKVNLIIPTPAEGDTVGEFEESLGQFLGDGNYYYWASDSFYPSDDSSRILESADVFEKGISYTGHANTLSSSTGIGLSDSVVYLFADDTQITVNGQIVPSDECISHPEIAIILTALGLEKYDAALIVPYTFIPSQKLSEITEAVLTIAPPVEGDTAAEVTPEMSPSSYDDDAGFVAFPLSMQPYSTWYVKDDSSSGEESDPEEPNSETAIPGYKEFTGQFEVGQTYFVPTVLTAKPGNLFGGALTVTANGEEVSLDEEGFFAEGAQRIAMVPVTCVPLCTLSFDGNGGQGDMDALKAGAGKTIDLPENGFTAPSGKQFKEWTIDGKAYPEGAVYVLARDTTAYANWEDTPTDTIPSTSGGGVTTYPVNLPDDLDGGTITAKPTRASEGSKVILTPTPDDGYKVDKVTVTDKDGNPVEVTPNDDGTYTFKMPKGGANVTATFVKDETPAEKFVDVPKDAYYHDAVYWAVDKGITDGTDDTHFSPDGKCTRAQMVTFLWRDAGKPAPAGTDNPFADVKEGTYYYDAVLWAVEKGITEGTSDTTFSPEDTVTRGQAVTFLWRDAGKPAPTGTDTPFNDVTESDYYYEPVLWAVEKGITDGTSDTTFSPAQSCLRCQIVTFLYRAAGQE